MTYDPKQPRKYKKGWNKIRAGKKLIAARCSKAYELRIQGYQYKEIAEKIGVSESRAWEYIQHYLKYYLPEKTKQELKAIIDDRVELITSVVMKRIIDEGDVKQVKNALNAIKLAAQLAGLLKEDVSVNNNPVNIVYNLKEDDI